MYIPPTNSQNGSRPKKTRFCLLKTVFGWFMGPTEIARWHQQKLDKQKTQTPGYPATSESPKGPKNRFAHGKRDFRGVMGATEIATCGGSRSHRVNFMIPRSENRSGH